MKNQTNIRKPEYVRMKSRILKVFLSIAGFLFCGLANAQFCENDPSFTAKAVCYNQITDVQAGLGQYYVEVDVSDRGSYSGLDITDGDGGILDVEEGIYVFGPYDHTNDASGTNEFKNIRITNSTNITCFINVRVVEFFCGFDPSGDHDGVDDTLEDESLNSNGFSCNCDDPAYPVTILSQQEPETFDAGADSGKIMLYVLTRNNGRILAINNSGYFDSSLVQMRNGKYKVYHLNIEQTTWDGGLSDALLPGVKIENVFSSFTLCESCFDLYDVYCECFRPLAAAQNSTSCTSICADGETNLSPEGAELKIDLNFGDFVPIPDTHLYDYAWIIASGDSTILNVVPSQNFKDFAFLNFSDNVDIRLADGNMLAKGDYCIYGISYVNVDSVGNIPVAVDLSTLQSYVGQNITNLASKVYRTDGFLTEASQNTPPSYELNADLRLKDCISISIVEPVEFEGTTLCKDLYGDNANDNEWYIEIDEVKGGTGVVTLTDEDGNELIGTNSIAGTYYFGPFPRSKAQIDITARDNNGYNDACVGCTSVRTFDAPEFPEVDIVHSDICAGEVMILQDEGSGSDSWQWNGPANFSSDLDVAAIGNFQPFNEGVYSLVGRSEDGCASRVEQEIEVSNSPIITVQPDDIYTCSGEVAIFKVDATIGTGAALTYQWYRMDQQGNIFSLFGENGKNLVINGASGTNFYFAEVNADNISGLDCTVKSKVAALGINGGVQLACTDDLNISLDNNCSLDQVNVNLFLENEVDPNFYDWYIIDPETNEVVDLNNIGDYTGRCLIYEVSNICDDNVCWGNVCLDDQIIPANVNCECETPYMDDGDGNLVENPDCVFYCYDVWDLELLEDAGGANSVLPDVSNNEPNDNCYEFEDPEVRISIIDGQDCNDKIVVRTLTYTFPSGHGNEDAIECVQQFLFKSISLDSCGPTVNGAWDGYASIEEASGHEGIYDFYKPEAEVIIPCGWDISPQGVASYYDLDTPGRPEGVSNDDYEETPNIIEHQEGYSYAYPYVVVKGYNGDYHAKPVINNICNLYAVYTDNILDECIIGCNGGYKIARTWTLVDWCNANTEEFVQFVVSRDLEGPVVEVNDITVSTDPWACTGTVEFPRPEHLYDECSDFDQVWYYITGPSGIEVENFTAYDVPKGKSQFFYWGVDCCGNETAAPVTVTVADQVPPVAITIEGIVVSLTSSGNPGDQGIGKVYAYDLDNGSHDECSPIVHYEVRRETPYCRDGNGTYNNDGHPEDDELDDDNGAYVTFCCEDVDYDQIDPLSGNAFGTVKVFLRVWDDGDMDGLFGSPGDNYNEIWTNVKVEDKLGPEIICPENVMIDCYDDFNDYSIVGKPRIYQACEELECEISDSNPNDQYVRKSASQQPFQGLEFEAYNPSCRSGAIRRTWRCGDKECRQWILVNPAQNIDLQIDWPEDRIIECLEEDTQEPQILSNPCELMAVNVDPDTFYFEAGACYNILNNWTIINWCQYDPTDSDINDVIDEEDDGEIPGLWQHTQVVKYFDQTPPEIIVQDTCYSVTGECKTGGVIMEARAVDNGSCGAPWLHWTVEIDLWDDWSIDYIYSSTANADSPYYLSPTTGSGSFIVPTESGETVSLELIDGLPIKCGEQHRVVWHVNDGCSNNSVTTSYFTLEDKKKPTPYCLNVSTALMDDPDGSGPLGPMIELWASDFNAGSFDNCASEDELFYTFSNIPPPQLTNSLIDPWYDIDGVASQTNYLNGDAEQWNEGLRSSSKVFDCDELNIAFDNGGYIPVEVYVWDACGNYDFCILNLGLIDNTETGCGFSTTTAMISGRVVAENGQGVEGITMQLVSESNADPIFDTTDSEGEYAFPHNPMNQDYIISGVKDDEYLNGVSTLDLVLIQRHVLGLDILDSPYKLIAADANSDERITAIDLVEIRKLILGVFAELPNNSSWRLVDSEDDLDPVNPWPFDEITDLVDLETNMLKEDFIGVKIGDVNGTVALSLGDNIAQRSANNKFIIKNKKLKKEEIYTIDILGQDYTDVRGFQMALALGNLELLNVVPGTLPLSSANYNMVDNTLSVSYHDAYGQTTDDVLFSIEVKANKNGWIQDQIGLSNQVLNGEMYSGKSLTISGLQLDIVGENGPSVLLQNDPNPWTDFTSIQFNMAKKGNASLTIYDVSGKILFEKSDRFEPGINELIIDKSHIQVSGILYYQLETEGFKETKKMIKLD